MLPGWVWRSGRPGWVGASHGAGGADELGTLVVEHLAYDVIVHGASWLAGRGLLHAVQLAAVSVGQEGMGCRRLENRTCGAAYKPIRPVPGPCLVQMAEPALQPLQTSYYCNFEPFGCFVQYDGELPMALVVDNHSKVAPLLGANGREGLSIGQFHTLQWGSNTPGAVQQARPQLAAPVWDPYTGSAFGFTHEGHAVVRLLSDNSCTIVAGHATEAGMQEGPGPSARFTFPNCLATDGQGALYLVDRNRLWKLMLPSSWKRTATLSRSPDSPSSAAASTAGAACGPQAAAGEAAEGHGPHQNAQGPESVMVSIVPTGEAPDHFYQVAYDPMRQAAVLVNHSALHVRPLTAGAAAETVLLAGCDREAAYLNGVGAEARFQCILDIAVDGKGHVIVLDSATTTASIQTCAGLPQTAP